MIKWFNRKLTIIAAGALFLFSVFPRPDAHCAGMEFDAGYYGIRNSSAENAGLLPNADSFQDLPTRGIYNNSLIPHFSWVNFFAAKMVEKRDIFPWNTPTPIEEDRFDQIGGMQYELYEGEFRHIDYIRRDIVKNLIPRTAEELLKKTRTGRKLDLLSRKLASYFTIQYFKTEDHESGFYLPGYIGNDQPANDRDLYGVSLSARLFNDVNSSPLEYALELNSFYSSSICRVRYEPSDSRVELTLRDLKFEEILDCRAAFEFVSEPSENYGMIKVFFDF